MSKHSRKLVVSGVLLAMLMVLSACGVRHGHHVGMNPDRIMKKATKKLDLNMEQQGFLMVVLETTQEFSVKLRQQHTDLKAPLLADLAQDQLDVDNINAQFESIDSDFSQFRQTMVSAFADFHASLNAEQRDEVVSLMEKIQAHRKH